MAAAKAKKQSSGSNVTRIKASSAASSKAKSPKVAPTVQPTATKQKSPLVSVVAVPAGYFKGAWEELKQVRWPTRQATWGLTLAVILFTMFFAIFILLLDAGFKYLFEQLLG